MLNKSAFGIKEPHEAPPRQISVFFAERGSSVANGSFEVSANRRQVLWSEDGFEHKYSWNAELAEVIGARRPLLFREYFLPLRGPTFFCIFLIRNVSSVHIFYLSHHFKTYLE